MDVVMREDSGTQGVAIRLGMLMGISASLGWICLVNMLQLCCYLIRLVKM